MKEARFQNSSFKEKGIEKLKAKEEQQRRVDLLCRCRSILGSYHIEVKMNKDILILRSLEVYCLCFLVMNTLTILSKMQL